MPFASTAQQRMFFAKGKDDPKFAKMAHEWAHEGPKGYIKNLPKKIRNNKDRGKAKRALKTKSFKECARYFILGRSYE